ncbi:MAG: acylneuraminate cytidylyltransferase family protein [Elusimicrobiota bacterium]|jgi:N-acylneuraminate cytidylyltransferase/CMP-N,N'-diacetyllegionaminic acid synthase
MRILGIIPARGGSKGIPGKNIKLLGGVPLIGHTIRAARESGCVDRLWVSTDDSKIARAAESLGVPVPWLRPARLATDKARTEDCVVHLLGKLKEDEGYVPDAVILLQPTSPFRSAETIRRAVRLFEKGGGRGVVSVALAPMHPYWCFRVEKGRLVPFCPAKSASRRQDLPPAYCYDGSVYLVATGSFLRTRSFSGKGALALIVPEHEVLDIDEPSDWVAAEARWARLSRR